MRLSIALLNAAKPVQQFSKVPSEKLIKLRELQSQIFRETYNPDGIRTGAKYLKKALKGQQVANYYGGVDFPTAHGLRKLLSTDEYELVDEEEEYRLASVDDDKKRGKGAPKKIREAPKKVEKGGQKKKK